MDLREVTQGFRYISEFIKLHLKILAMVCELLYDFPLLLIYVIVLLLDMALVTDLMIRQVVLTLFLELMTSLL
jgi:hypothetical protein